MKAIPVFMEQDAAPSRPIMIFEILNVSRHSDRDAAMMMVEWFLDGSKSLLASWKISLGRRCNSVVTCSIKDNQ